MWRVLGFIGFWGFGFRGFWGFGFRGFWGLGFRGFWGLWFRVLIKACSTRGLSVQAIRSWCWVPCSGRGR